MRQQDFCLMYLTLAVLQVKCECVRAWHRLGNAVFYCYPLMTYKHGSLLVCCDDAVSVPMTVEPRTCEFYIISQLSGIKIAAPWKTLEAQTIFIESVFHSDICEKTRKFSLSWHANFALQDQLEYCAIIVLYPRDNSKDVHHLHQKEKEKEKKHYVIAKHWFNI